MKIVIVSGLPDAEAGVRILPAGAGLAFRVDELEIVLLVEALLNGLLAGKGEENNGTLA